MKKTAKAQTHGVLSPDVYNPETSTAPHKEGTVKKRNAYGLWQPRFFYLNNAYLVYAKKKGGEVKGVIDLSNTSQVKHR